MLLVVGNALGCFVASRQFPHRRRENRSRQRNITDEIRREHEVSMLGEVELRIIYVASEAAPRPLDTCSVFEVSDLLAWDRVFYP
jgi:hypothetical protein